jgi:putative NADPH-quinone reductase
MSKHIVIVQGHPDPAGGRFCRALASAYQASAEQAGHKVRLLEVAQMDFPVLRTKDDWDHGTPVESIKQAQGAIAWAQHLVIVYPMWLGTLPALLEAFFEQVLRPGFALATSGKGFGGLLKGRSARVIVTMGMPALVYRWYFRAHSLKSFERNVLRFCGIAPIRETLIGMVEAGDAARRERWLARMRELGHAGD